MRGGGRNACRRGGAVGGWGAGALTGRGMVLYLADKGLGSQDGAMPAPGVSRVSQKSVGSAQVIRSPSKFGKSLNCNLRPFH